jgi:hypothetical protein
VATPPTEGKASYSSDFLCSLATMYITTPPAIAAMLIRVIANQPQPGVFPLIKPRSNEKIGTPNPSIKSIRIGINIELSPPVKDITNSGARTNAYLRTSPMGRGSKPLLKYKRAAIL